MNIQYMRNYLKQQYPGPNWATKVDKMTDKQVYAIYMRIINKEK